MSKPFIKWVGGKSRLLPEIKKMMPKNIIDYHEPFVGGGAVLFSLTGHETATINDYNKELINAYQVIKKDPCALMDKLDSFEKSETFFYEIRQWDRINGYNNLSAVTKAARFIYLNKMGFNGLYRVNSKNQNNVPYGKNPNISLYNKENILSCSYFLQNVNIISGNYKEIFPFLNEKSFIYLDPPYIPLSKTSNFTGYTNKGFDIHDQKQLKEFCDDITSIGAKFMLSNSTASLTYELYENYNINNIEIYRGIANNNKHRKKINEVIVTNYDLPLSPQER